MVDSKENKKIDLGVKGLKYVYCVLTNHKGDLDVCKKTRYWLTICLLWKFLKHGFIFP